MKLDITEKEFTEKLRGNSTPTLAVLGVECGDIDASGGAVITVLKRLGLEFKQKIDWEAETHDPRVIPDGWLIEAWDDDSTHMRVTGFFDGKNNCTCYGDGERDGHGYDNYRAIKKEDWPKWAIEQHKSLED